MASIPQPKASGGVFGDQLEGQEIPPEGTYVATILDIVDQFQVTRKKFQSEETEVVDQTQFLFGFRTPEGEPFKISSRPMVISGNEKSNLFKFLKGIMGKAPKVGWDYCELKGSKCQICIEHQPSRDGSRVYANISSQAPFIQQAPAAAAPKAAAPKAAGKKPPAAPPPVEDFADEVPF